MEQILQRLLEIDGVTGALLVGKDGLVVASTMDGEEEEFLAAMAAACYDATLNYIGQLGMGDIHHAIFEAAGGAVQIADGGDMLIVVRSTLQANVGRIRMECAHARLHLAETAGKLS